MCVCARVHTKSVYRGHRDLPFLIILMALFDLSKNMVPSLLVRSGEGRVEGSEHSYPLTTLVSFMRQICGIFYYARAIVHPSTPWLLYPHSHDLWLYHSYGKPSRDMYSHQHVYLNWLPFAIAHMHTSTPMTSQLRLSPSPWWCLHNLNDPSALSSILKLPRELSVCTKCYSNCITHYRTSLLEITGDYWRYILISRPYPHLRSLTV